MVILDKFRFFYGEYHKGICTACYESSQARMQLKEPAWFGHQKCADAFRKLRLLFAHQMMEKETPIYDT